MNPFTSMSAMMSRLGPYHLAAVILGLALCAAFVLIIADLFLLQSHSSSTDKKRKPSHFAKLKNIHVIGSLLVGLLVPTLCFITSSYGSAAMDTFKDRGPQFLIKLRGTTQNTSTITSPFLGLVQYLNVSMLPSGSSLYGKSTDHILYTPHFGLVNSSVKQIINSIRHDEIFSVTHNESNSSSSSSLFLNKGDSDILVRNDTYNVSVSLNISGLLDILLHHTDSDEMVPVIENIFTRAIEANHYLIGSTCYTATAQMVNSVNSTLTDAEAIFAHAKDEIHVLAWSAKDEIHNLTHDLMKTTCPNCPTCPSQDDDMRRGLRKFFYKHWGIFACILGLVMMASPIIISNKNLEESPAAKIFVYGGAFIVAFVFTFAPIAKVGVSFFAMLYIAPAAIFASGKGTAPDQAEVSTVGFDWIDRSIDQEDDLSYY